MHIQPATHFPPHQHPSGGCSGRSRSWGRHSGPGRAGGPPWGRLFHHFPQPVPVNIESSEGSFVLRLYAAGLNKENFSIAVQDDVLTVAYRGEEGQNHRAPDPRYTHREFRAVSFERAFQLNGKVLIEGITAHYAEGILTITLPKNPAANQPAQAIPVA